MTLLEFQAVQQWYNNDTINRKDSLRSILRLLRYSLMSTEFLGCVVLGRAIVRAAGDQQLHDITARALYWSTRPMEERRRVLTGDSQLNCTPRCSAASNKTMSFCWELKGVGDLQEHQLSYSPCFFVHGYYM